MDLQRGSSMRKIRIKSNTWSTWPKWAQCGKRETARNTRRLISDCRQPPPKQSPVAKAAAHINFIRHNTCLLLFIANIKGKHFLNFSNFISPTKSRTISRSNRSHISIITTAKRLFSSGWKLYLFKFSYGVLLWYTHKHFDDYYPRLLYFTDYNSTEYEYRKLRFIFKVSRFLFHKKRCPLSLGNFQLYFSIYIYKASNIIILKHL